MPLDNENRQARDLRETLVDLLLEEHFERAALDRGIPMQPRPSRPHRVRLLTAALLVLGIGVVLAVQRSNHADLQTAKTDATIDVLRPPASAYFPLEPGNTWAYAQHVDGQDRLLTIRATAAQTVAGNHVVQLAECGNGAPRFSFWSVDGAGVHRHMSPASDPCLGDGADRVLVLPWPVVVNEAWPVTLRRDARPTRDHGDAVLRSTASTAQPIRCTARIVAREHPVHVGDHSWDCIHLVIDADDDQHSEHLFLARGIGIVKHTVRTHGSPEEVRELISFERFESPPDRSTLLETQAKIPSMASTTWLDLERNAAWTLSSEFAIVTDDRATRVFRVFRDRVRTFDPTDLNCYVELASDEGLADRLGGRSSERMLLAITWLRWALHEAVTGEIFETESTGFSLGASHDHGEAIGTLRTATGARAARVDVTFERGVPTQVELR